MNVSVVKGWESCFVPHSISRKRYILYPSELVITDNSGSIYFTNNILRKSNSSWNDFTGRVSRGTAHRVFYRLSYRTLTASMCLEKFVSDVFFTFRFVVFELFPTKINSPQNLYSIRYTSRRFLRSICQGHQTPLRAVFIIIHHFWSCALFFKVVINLTILNPASQWVRTQFQS